MSDNGKSLSLLPREKVRAIKCMGGIYPVIEVTTDGFVVRFHVVSPEGEQVKRPFEYPISPPDYLWSWTDEALGIIEIEHPELALVPDTRP